MNKSFFETKIEELATAFQVSTSGEKWRGILKVYYNALNNKMNDNNFSDICHAILTEEERFPTVAKFFAYRKRFYKPSEFKQSACALCGGSGSVSAIKNGYEYCFCCNRCDAWQGRLSEQIPLWGSMQGYSLKNYEGWDSNDTNQLKGLLLFGKNSIALKKSSPEVQQAALNFARGGWKPKTEILQTELSPQKEKIRAISLSQEKERELYFNPSTGKEEQW